MRIGIDARILERRMTGIGRYLSDLVKHLPLCDGKNHYTLFSYNAIAGYGAANVENVPTVNIPAEGKFQKLASPFWLNFILPRFVKKEKIDILFSPNNQLPIKRVAPRNVVAIMDVFPFIDPQFHSTFYGRYSMVTLKNSARKADRILTISECSKRDIVKFLGVPEEKVSVTYLSAGKQFTPRELSSETRTYLQQKYGLSERFILYVGVIEKRKNIGGIIRITDLLNKPGDLPIVLVGRPGHGGAEYITEFKHHKNLHYCGFVADEDVPYLYNLASAFLFPSFYEGFGLPVLEAMQSGLPVVASDTSSLPEVIGRAGIMLPPDDHEAFARELMAIARDDAKHRLLRDAGLAQAKLFTAEKTARETINALNAFS